MRVFKFLTRKYGLLAIQNRRLKISTIESTNDPFEFLPFDLSNKGQRWATEQTKKQIGTDTAMLCFSQTWNNPVIWSHYADSHAGMCLEFETGALDARPVRYIKEPLPFDDPQTVETVQNMLYAKFDDWHYESEIRIWTTRKDKDGDLYFMDFDNNLVLQRVLLGVGCTLTDREIDKAIGPYTHPVTVQKIRRSSNKFEMEIDNRRETEVYEKVAKKWSDMTEGVTFLHPKVGRNDLCSCGSGKKYKKCHGA